MKPYREMTRDELLAEKQVLEEEYRKVLQKKLKLDMSRGKPSKEQLALSLEMMDVLDSGS